MNDKTDFIDITPLLHAQLYGENKTQIAIYQSDPHEYYPHMIHVNFDEAYKLISAFEKLMKERRLNDESPSIHEKAWTTIEVMGSFLGNLYDVLKYGLINEEQYINLRNTFVAYYKSHSASLNDKQEGKK